jgi:hypothetical protein
MCALQPAEHEGPGVSLFTELRRGIRIAFTGTGVAVLMGLSLFSSIAHADEASLEDLVMDPTASISVGSLKFDNFALDRVFGDPSMHVEVTGITTPDGETGIRFTGDYEPSLFGLGVLFDMMLFTVTTADPFSLLHDMTLTFDADPIFNPDEDHGVAWVWAGIMVCTKGTFNFGPQCGLNDNEFVARTMFHGSQGAVDLRQLRLQVEVYVANSGAFRNLDITFSQVPEPSTFLLLGTAVGIALLVARSRRIA